MNLKSLLLIEIFPQKLRQSIRSPIHLIFTIINLEIVKKDLPDPANLPRIEMFYSHKLRKVVMMSKNKNFILTAFS